MLSKTLDNLYNNFYKEIYQLLAMSYNHLINMNFLNILFCIILLIGIISIIIKDWFKETFISQNRVNEFIGSLVKNDPNEYVTNNGVFEKDGKKNLSGRSLTTNILFTNNEFNKNASHSSCCPSVFSNAAGCVCLTSEQSDFLNQRGGNRSHGNI
jgi:hypothetical protein